MIVERYSTIDPFKHVPKLRSVGYRSPAWGNRCGMALSTISCTLAT